MSERTTIGGTVYETIGSSTSNLLLKCNGTARIQWGTKLIDLVKNGKIASGDSSAQISVVSNESDIKTDGIYVIDAEKSSRLIIRKKSENYDFTDTELYISASNKQDLTVEQQKQAMENIGMYYDTLDDVHKAGIQNGIVYVLEDRSLYTIKDGDVLEFEAKLKTVSVEKENEDGERLNSSVKVVLSVLDKDYIVLKDNRITIKQNTHIAKHTQFGSENATSEYGYRLYFLNDQSWLDVDNINVRNGITIADYIEVTFSELRSLISQDRLTPHSWYVIKDYQNVWRIPANNTLYDRPIMIRALNGSSFYPEGMLFEDRRVLIKYDHTYIKDIINDSGSRRQTRGMITWMKDVNNNEANFDFLDYSDDKDSPLTTLHYITETKEDSTGTTYTSVGTKSVFPLNSYNNKITIHNLKGTVIKNERIDNTYANTIDFQIHDSPDLTGTEVVSDLEYMDMHDNVIECYGITATSSCVKFNNNNITRCGIIKFNGNCYNNTLTDIYSTTSGVIANNLSEAILSELLFNSSVDNTTINSCSNSTINGVLSRSTFGNIISSTINGGIYSSSFKDVSNCTINADLNKVTFNNLNTCLFDYGTIESLTCRSDLPPLTIDSTTYPILYDTSKIKDVYYINGQFQVVESASVGFAQGMIMMHSGIAPIPDGWEICDGRTVTVNGSRITLPNLVGRFIKAVSSSSEVGETDVHTDNKMKLSADHLPAHTHPHQEHTHEISTISGNIEESGDLSLSLPSSYISDLGMSATLINLESGDNSVITSANPETQTGNVVGGNHTHNLNITGGTLSSSTSTESDNEWVNQEFSIEPNYYSLIFIMKL